MIVDSWVGAGQPALSSAQGGVMGALNFLVRKLYLSSVSLLGSLIIDTDRTCTNILPQRVSNPRCIRKKALVGARINADACNADGFNAEMRT
jgi:hypothetical protein